MPHQSLGWRKVRLHVVQRQSFQVHASADIQSMDQKAERHLTSATPVLIFVGHKRIPKLKQESSLLCLSTVRWSFQACFSRMEIKMKKFKRSFEGRTT